MNPSLTDLLREGLDCRRLGRRRWLWQASVWRALLETLACSLPLFAAIAAAGATVAGTPTTYALCLLGGAAALYLGLRARHPSGGFWHQLLYECLAGGALAAALPLVYAPLIRAAVGAGWLPDLPAGPLLMALVLSLVGPLYIGLRSCLRLWLVWDCLRRRRLVFAITHVYLTIALIAALPFVLVVAVFLGSSSLDQAVLSGGHGPAVVAVVFLLGILPAFVILTLTVIAGEVMLIPPLALIAYAAARRVTGRLVALAEAVESIRQGDYAARVAVSGEDEVARLQSNINSMAAHLQQALTDLQAERDRVAALLDSRRELVANVSHELRTPVATVRAYLDSIVEGQDEPSADRLRHDLSVMGEEVTRLQGLIEDLFALSRGEVGPEALHLAPTDVAATIRAAVDAMAPLAWRSGSVHVVADLRGPLPVVRADASRLRQVLANLLRNAIRHTPPGGIVAVSAEELPGAVAIHVCDTGSGIAAEDLPHVWERFSHGAESDGTGLGLAIVKEMVTTMQGTVTATSTPGQGSCFTVALPTDDTSTQTLARGSAELRS